ncbi:hypothetical protein Tsubulata_011532 [Turnera subulata]|uniref:Dicer-like protein 4 n=1 Tax=Turnera subulata TaxID=218843 RepID=A0A9Q0JSB5_9ROSI|nr:hypothetical protein Tsubulata_011532 [Turnera subulata]
MPQEEDESLLLPDGAQDSKHEKDPRKIARKYQLELCKRALEENIIVYLGTGCGKTHIAVLLMYELRHLVRNPLKSVCVFLAPTVALVHQQAKVIEECTDFIVGIHCGSSNRSKSHSEWEKEIEECEVLVMTPQILLRNLSHSFIKMDFISLLIFDECHHAQLQKDHPYAEIMRIFYKDNKGKVPRIFGMTASPVVGKGASRQANLTRSINSLEHILDAKVFSVDNEEVESLVASPAFKVYLYGPLTDETYRFYGTCCCKLEDVKRQIGLLGALHACEMLLGGDDSEWNALVETDGSFSDNSVCDRYLTQAAVLFADCRRDGTASDISEGEVLQQPFFSCKLLRLIDILSTFRIITARSLSYVLQNLKVLTSWKCDFLVGVHSGLKSVSRKTMNSILEKFRTGELNLLIATKVGEEGLDIPTCCLVIRFDLPETVVSFIQSRGRARMPQSEYAFLVDSGNQKELDLIERFRKEEDQMNVEVSIRTSDEIFYSPKGQVYKVDTSGASTGSGNSISLLHQYCAKLPHDEYFDPKPTFSYFDDLGGTVCQVNLPSNAPIHRVVSTPLSSMEAAKKDACTEAIKQLHQLGALNNFLLPDRADAEDKVEGGSSDSDDCEGKDSRGELQKMLVPAVLKEPWTISENPFHLYSYYIEFCPIPEDRMYKKFGLFIRAPLPKEAEDIEVELHLARGRSVMTRLAPSGRSVFTRDEIMRAVKFQAMFLKVILDRSEFLNEFVQLGDEAFLLSNPTSYLLLPVVLHGNGNRMTVDWEVQSRCLSSPIFRNPVDVVDKNILPSDSQLQLANGCRSISHIVNSLVYTPHKNNFFFIVDIVHEKNGYSPYKEHSLSSDTRNGIQLKCPKQPLLRAKPLFFLRNLLHNRKQEDSEPEELEEYFIDLPPELCQLKIIGFSKDIGSSISLLPSLMHRLENFLVAIELKYLFSASFPEGAEVTATRVLEALTTEKCQERFSLERLEVLGDAFLKFAVGRHLFLLYDTLDEGELTRKRSNIVNNSNLLKLALRSNLQVYIRDQPFDPLQFFALGRPCPRICTKESKGTIHSQHKKHEAGQANGYEFQCSKGHHWLYKKTVADAIEALVGAFIVDSGFKAATAFLKWIGIQVDFDASQVINLCQASASYLPLAPSMESAALEDLLGYQFLYKGLLLQAFVHPSFYKQGGGCYQRLEFLGDAVSDYLITSYLFSAYPKLKPGHLTDLRSVLVNNQAFARVAVDRSFHMFLLCDSSCLTESIKKYVEFVNRHASESDLLEAPKCPKKSVDRKVKTEASFLKVHANLSSSYVHLSYMLGCGYPMKPVTQTGSNRKVKTEASFLKVHANLSSSYVHLSYMLGCGYPMKPVTQTGSITYPDLMEVSNTVYASIVGLAKVLGDLVESCLGAMLLDTGFNLNFVWKMILSFLDPIASLSSVKLNPVRELREICQSRSWNLQVLTSRKGRTFLAEVKVSGKDVNLPASARNSNRKEAIRTAAEQIFMKLKDQGCVPKCNILEEVLRSSCKLEAKLIGFDETPIDVISPYALNLENLKVEEPVASNSKAEVHSSRKVSSASSTIAKLKSDRDAPSTARQRLYEVCTANCWKPPMFECCYEEGLSHLKIFTYKVIVVIEDAPDMILECIGAPQSKKKAAAEHAAEAALWYLEREGYLLQSEKGSRV